MEANWLGNILDSLKKNTKIELYGTLAIMPIWFLGINLFGQLFFNNHPIYISLILSYCLAIGSLPFWIGILDIIERLVGMNFDSHDSLISAISFNSVSLIFSMYRNYINTKPESLRLWVVGYFHWIVIPFIILLLIAIFVHLRKAYKGK